ncbi:hypothetical protein B0T17DRAFT_568243 [Bombardia bombarda]|uniref:Uncharacterized protein n=1 Tax=Bombardia bombarda TaxID=252184 RepID=A0AA39XJP9_9PEZI|nr:hypothetical protein B0T17DRAFT_568243 [Bombardia bombarda]
MAQPRSAIGPPSKDPAAEPDTTKGKEKEKEQKPSEQIPHFVHIAPSIFTPLPPDFGDKLSDIPRDRLERLKRILESIDYQREGVVENIMWMIEREKTRLILEASEVEAAQGQKKPTGLDQAEADRIIANMEAPADPGMDYNIKTIGTVEELLPPLGTPTNESLRDKTVSALLRLVEFGIVQVQGYELHMTKTKQHYLDRVEKEAQKIREAGMRPEERTGAAEAPM